MFSVIDEVVVEKLGAITTIGLNRPEKRNCVNSTTARKLSEAISNFENDDAALVGVLHGIGGNFCSGYDLSELSALGMDTEFKLEPGRGPMVRDMLTPQSGNPRAMSYLLILLNIMFLHQWEDFS